MARITHHRITPRVVKEIRSFRKEDVSTKGKRLQLYLWVEPGTQTWLIKLAEKIGGGVGRADIVRYFVNEKLKEPAMAILKREGDAELKEALRRVRSQMIDSCELTVVYVLPELYETIDARTVADELAFGEFLHLALIRAIKE